MILAATIKGTIYFNSSEKKVAQQQSSCDVNNSVIP
jgi:hypothetical protein